MVWYLSSKSYCSCTTSGNAICQSFSFSCCLNNDLGEHCSITFPCLITMISSAYRATSFISCDTNMTVLWWLTWIDFINSITCWRLFGSSPAVGSSRIIIFGFIARIETNAILRIWPPDISNGDCSIIWWSKPKSKSNWYAYDLTCSTFILKFLGPNATSLSTLSSNNCDSGNWKTKPTCCLNSRRCLSFVLWVISLLSKVILPFVGFNSPLKCWMSVDLPLPVWPTIA